MDFIHKGMASCAFFFNKSAHAKRWITLRKLVNNNKWTFLPKRKKVKSDIFDLMTDDKPLK